MKHLMIKKWFWYAFFTVWHTYTLADELDTFAIATSLITLQGPTTTTEVAKGDQEELKKLFPFSVIPEDLSDTLLWYAKEGNLSAIKTLLNSGAKVNAKNFQARTPLHLAAEGNNEEIIKLLLENKADVDSKDFNQYTPLHLAAQSNYSAPANILIENGADLQAKTNTTATPIDIAAQKGNIGVVALILDHAKKKNLKLELDQALLIASLHAHFNIVKLLVAGGAQPTAQDSLTAYTPLHYAVAQDNLEAVKLLLPAGASPNKPDANNQTPVHFAAMSGNLEMLKLMIENYRGNLKLKDRWSKTPLTIAKDNVRTYITDQLKKNMDIFEALYSKSLSPKEKYDTIENILISNTDSLRLKNQLDQATPLNVAVDAGYIDITKLLIDAGADVNTPDRHGRLPLYSAVMRAATVEIPKKQHEFLSIIPLLVNDGGVFDLPTKIKWRDSFNALLPLFITAIHDELLKDIVEKDQDQKVENVVATLDKADADFLFWYFNESSGLKQPPKTASIEDYAKRALEFYGCQNIKKLELLLEKMSKEQLMSLITEPLLQKLMIRGELTKLNALLAEHKKKYFMPKISTALLQETIKRGKLDFLKKFTSIPSDAIASSITAPLIQEIVRRNHRDMFLYLLPTIPKNNITNFITTPLIVNMVENNQQAMLRDLTIFIIGNAEKTTMQAFLRKVRSQSPINLTDATQQHYFALLTMIFDKTKAHKPTEAFAKELLRKAQLTQEKVLPSKLLGEIAEY